MIQKNTRVCHNSQGHYTLTVKNTVNNLHNYHLIGEIHFKRVHTLFLECHEIHLPCFEPCIYENHMTMAICVPVDLQSGEKIRPLA